ncbi:SARP family pathway specific regulatory protein [Amycolatopsis decaplanina DSM 44594]|uniref:SARP family pathway specific regulatory protein n=1 Tax=Amycolatopsis decaplanina DSM 44594 TaxID=1284240 RepID=M2ZBB7_9PSEU|nr:SARP family pathway specific regulatory protein [Amycolatopsis decaplanina DSM 44594]
MPTAPKLRALLTLFLLNVNKPLSIGAMVKELWGVRPPVSAVNTLQTYVFQLRRWMAEVAGVEQGLIAKKILITDGEGYLFRLGQEMLDLQRFEDRARAGARELGLGNNAEAAALLRAALDLWRGSIALEFQPGQGIQARIVQLEENRLYVLEQRIDADLRLGRHRELVGELASLIVEHSLHESLHSKLMIAFHRCGRTADALNVFRDFRERIIQELGIEPSPEFQSLHQAVLSRSRLLDAPI